MRALQLKIPPALIALAFGAAMSAAAANLPAAAFHVPYARHVGAGTAVLGLAVVLLGMFTFMANKTTVDPHQPSRASALVTSGIYRATRNPMYLGFLLVLAGWALLAGNWIAVVLLPLFIVLLNKLQIEPEERILEEHFGDAYRAYKARTRRWI